MSVLSNLGLRAVRSLDPERAHRAAINGLRSGLVPKWDGALPGVLRMKVLGFDLAHPLGLAAGFDKNAEAVGPLLNCGFSFVEVGAVTPRPQPGNPKPRLFRLSEDAAAINRFGFNNEGVEAVRKRLFLKAHPARGPVGVNLGANKDSTDRAADYVTVLTRLADCADFFTINVSSPNTQGLRDLQERSALDDLIGGVLAARDEKAAGKPVLLKLAPDLSDVQLTDVVEVCMERGIDGIVATNTTLSREGLRSKHQDEMGGLSGQPVFEKSTAILRRIAEITEGKVPLVGVGGVGSAAQAYAKIRAGASLVQLYTALSYHGMDLVPEIVKGLAKLLERDGFATIAQAVGADVRT
jgi:dihydroorotate dehydrogenase